MSKKRKSGGLGAADRPPIPPEFAADLRQAVDAEQRYGRTGEQNAFDTAAAAWKRVLDASTFVAMDNQFQLGALDHVGLLFWRRYESGGGGDDLSSALICWRRALAQMPAASPDLPRSLYKLGVGLHHSFSRTGQVEDLQEAIQLYQRVVAATPKRASELSLRRYNLGLLLRERFDQMGRPEDLDEAIRILGLAVKAPSPDSSDLPVRLDKLAQALRTRFQRTQRAGDLDQAIRVMDRAVKATPPDSSYFPARLNNLGLLLRDRFRRTGRTSDLEEAIRVLDQAVKTTTPDSSDFPARLSNLSLGLCDRFEQMRRPEDLDEAIRISDRAVKAAPSDSLDLPAYLNDLGTRLGTRFRQTGQLEDLEEGIRLIQRAVAASSEGSAALPTFLSNLGDMLVRHCDERIPQLDDLDEAIRVCERAVAATPEGAPQLPGTLYNLGRVLIKRFDRTGRLEDLDESIRASERAVAATPAGIPGLTGRLNALGQGLAARFVETGHVADLEEAIRLIQRAVAATPEGSPDTPLFLTNLGRQLRARFERTGRREDLEEAIRILERAIEVSPEGSLDLPGRLSSLANALSTRSEVMARPGDLDEAIRAYQRATATTPEGSPWLALYLNNLASALKNRFARTEQLEDLEEAIRLQQRVMAVAQKGTPDLPMFLFNISHGLHLRFEKTGHREDLEEAIRYCDRAVAETPAGSPRMPRALTGLGSVLHTRFELIGRRDDLEKATQCYRRACELGALIAPRDVLAASSRWGNWAIKRKEWGEAAEAYGYGLASGRQLLGRQQVRAQKQSVLGDLKGLSAPAAYAQAKLGRFKEAVETVERGRGRLLADALQRNRRGLEQLTERGHADLYQRYRHIVEAQERLTQPATTQPDQPEQFSSQDRLNAIVAANEAFDQVVSEIQNVPGYSDFLAEPTFAQIQTSAKDTPLVYLLATSSGGLALIAYVDEVEPVWLDELTDAGVVEWLRGPAADPKPTGWLGAYDRWLVERTRQAKDAWFAVVDDVTSRLWSRVMGPVAKALPRVSAATPSAAPAVTLIPTGLLAFLPLHAAWAKDPCTPTLRRYFMDEFTVGYAPSALALRYCRERAVASKGEHLLAINEPRPISLGSPLANAAREVTAIASLFAERQVLSRQSATRRKAHRALTKANFAHFACHGNNNWENPLESGLLMARDEFLTVRDFLDTQLPNTRLATLSSCETGIVGTELPDEVVMLPSALVQTGCAGVVASLWSVADASTAMLMVRFYQFWRLDHLEPSHALRAAQRWLRDTTNREKAGYFGQFVPSLAPRMTEPIAAEFFSAAMEMKEGLDARSFTNPFWWAAFYLTGV